MELVKYSTRRLNEVARGAVAIPTPATVFEVAGPGAVTCLQGLLTNDLVAAGPGSLRYGALLTPKGMIVADYWVFRVEDRFWLISAPAARESTTELLRRQLPPRLARTTDRSAEWAVLSVLGADAGRAVREALGSLPDPGRVAAVADLLIGRAPPGRAPFEVLVAGPAGAVAAAAGRLAAAGAVAGGDDDLRAWRVDRGVPTLGSEIDDRTLPQEAGFDELGGVSYTKGCYVGQETVARLHFRGQANWILRGLIGAGAPSTPAIERNGKPAARVGTVLQLDDGRYLALAKVRREIDPGTELDAGGPVRVVALPFGAAEG